LAGRGGAGEDYRVGRLINARQREPLAPRPGQRHIVCDIDKTYLETEFESLVRMARIAFEAAGDKVTVTGASDILLAARWGDVTAPLDSLVWPRPLHFVSSSPPQLRAVLEEKLMLDGLDWSSDTFKDQAYNLRMRRMDQLRQHVAYKSLAILRLIMAAGPGSRFCMLGDNAESDAYIYMGIKLLLDGHLDAAGYRDYLAAAGVDPAVAEDLVRELKLPEGCTVDIILIRNVPGYTFVRQEPLTDAVQTFDNFYQAALLLIAHGVIAPELLFDLTRKFHNRHGMARAYLRTALTPLLAGDEALAPLAGAARSVLTQLGFAAVPASQGEASAWAFRPRDLTQLRELSGARIIDNARLWQGKIRSLSADSEPGSR
jgi:hypothetical protein